MSTAVYFYKKAAKLTQETYDLTLLEISAFDVDYDVSGSLKDSWNSNTSFWDFAQDVMTNNAEQFTMLALEAGAASKNPVFGNMINMVFNLMALYATMYNDLLLIFMKTVAEELIKVLDKKAESLANVKDTMTNLYNALVIICSKPPVYDAYLGRLRSGLVELYLSKQELAIVRGALSTNDVFLSTRFGEAKAHLLAARDLITPLPNKDNPYMQPSWKSLLSSVGFPTQDDQMAMIVKLPKLAKKVLFSLKHYASQTLTANALILAFSTGLESLKTGLPALMKKYLLKLFTTTISQMQSVIEDMATVLNGDSEAIAGPVVNYEPIPLMVSGKAYQWLYEVEFLVSVVDTLFPQKQLEAWNLSQTGVNAYINAVNGILSKNTRTNGLAVLQARGGQENSASLETQIFTFITQATASLVSSKVRSEILTLGRTVLDRIDLSLVQDAEIKALLQTFINTPIPLESLLKQLKESLYKVLDDLGFDNAAEALSSGNFKAFFDMASTPGVASSVGAALAAIALLKKCFGNQADVNQIAEAEEIIKKDKDLLNIKITFNFKLSIFDKLQEILKYINLGNLYAEKEVVCGMLGALGFDTIYKNMEDYLSGAKKIPGAKVEENPG